MRGRLRSFRAVALIAFAVGVLNGCAEVVEPGHRGVETNFGEVKSQVLNEGLHWYSPFGGDIVVMDVRRQKWEFKTACYTKDLQEATLDVTATYALIPSAAPATLSTIGEDWSEKVVGQDVFDRIKGVCGQYTAENLIGERTKATGEMRDAVALALKANNVTLAGLAVTNIKYSDKYDDAVEEKAVADQQASAESNVTRKIREKAEQRRVDAQADADAMRLRAAAIRENQALLQWEALQVERDRIKKWNGGVSVYQFGGNGNGGVVPVVQLPSPPAAAVAAAITPTKVEK